MSVPARGNEHGLAGKILVDFSAGVSGGVLLNVIKDLKRVDHKKFLANKPELPRIVILTINGTMTTIGRIRISRRNNL